MISEFELPKGYEEFEISTQIIIRDALKRNIQIEILDKKENFLRLTQNSHSEFIKEASKTRLDSLMTYLVMENKVVSKKVLLSNGLRVPKGKNFDNLNDAIRSFDDFHNLKKVIKPVTTNFGIGIGISPVGDVLENYTAHLKTAFSFSGSVIVEEFIEGPEYRFLVLGGDVVAVCNRVPANVIGDGIRSITDLVQDKNKDPRRGEGHKTPLEKIQLTDVEKGVLLSVGKDFLSIPKLGEQVFLRKNSNISTGGDSVDVTDLVHPKFKEIAISAAKAADATICGIDIITTSIENEPNPNSHAILEINFNPVLYIHEFPYSGTPRNVGNRILDLLGFE